MEIRMTDDVAKFSIMLFTAVMLMVACGNEGMKLMERFSVVAESVKAIPHK